MKSYTSGNAYASFLDGKIGVLKQGYDADFTILENDILTIPQEKIKEVKAIRTVLKGKEVFLRK